MQFRAKSSLPSGARLTTGVGAGVEGVTLSTAVLEACPQAIANIAEKAKVVAILISFIIIYGELDRPKLNS